MTGDVVTILGLSGSLRRASFNAGLLRAAVAAAPAGTTVAIHDLGDVPFLNEDLEPDAIGPAVDALRDAIADADALLLASPEYNGGYTPVLKNAIDWASRPVRESALTNQTVSVIGASNGQFGAMWAQTDLRKVLGITGARVVGDELPVARAFEKFDSEGRLLDGELVERLGLVLGTLAFEAAGSARVAA